MSQYLEGRYWKRSVGFIFYLLGVSNGNQPTGATFLLQFGSRYRRSLGDSMYGITVSLEETFRDSGRFCRRQGMIISGISIH
jgi:hypothetical protein